MLTLARRAQAANARACREGYLDFKRSANGPAKLVNLKRPRASDRIFAFSSISAPIPKSDLERDDETNVALQWADKYAQALSKPT